jgi:hypothetical protein
MRCWSRPLAEMQEVLMTLWNPKALLALVVLGTAGAAGEVRAQSIRTCQSDDKISARALWFANMLATDTVRFARSVRAQYGIPFDTLTEVAQVEADSVCDAATAAMDMKSRMRSERALITVEIGTTPRFYVVMGPWDGTTGEIYLLDSKFALRSTFLGMK